MDKICEAFSEIVEIISKNPKTSAAVVTSLAMFLAGYGKGYRDGIVFERTGTPHQITG